MKFDRRLINGLAWAGLGLVIAVPVADVATSALAGKMTAPVLSVMPITSVAPATVAAQAVETPAVDVAVAAPAVTPRPADAPVGEPAVAAVKPVTGVEKFTSAGKQLPSYISDAGAAVVETPTVAAVGKPPAVTPTMTGVETAAAKPKAPEAEAPEVALATPALPTFEADPPVPMPASARPLPSPVPAVVAVSPQPPVLIIDEPTVKPKKRVTRVQAGSNLDEMVGPDELAQWESGPLSEFLAKRRGSSATFYDEVADPPLFQDAPVEGFPDGGFHTFN